MTMSLSSSHSWICEYFPEDSYSVYQCGSHSDGTFVRVYVPEAASQSETKLNAILYLHGFALCMPSFYEAHLIELVKAGYIVFFPDFQRSFYPNTSPKDPLPTRPSLAHFQTWLSVATQRSDRQFLGVDDFASLFPGVYERGDTGLGRGLTPCSASDLKRVARSLVTIVILLNICSWFRREYGKNLIHLLSTVALSLVHRPTEWLNNAICLVEDAWEYLIGLEQYSHWDRENLDTFAFGHSLGGLIALSLPFGMKDSTKSPFYPKKIVTADPAPSTEMGIPQVAIWILKLFRAPFTDEPILIQNTGASLNGPTAILHGGSDKLVPPKEWVDAPRGQCSNYDKIASDSKAIYFSYSNPDTQPPLVAFHNQAVTSTQYYDDALFKNFGGVKDGPNAYNREYIWPGVNLIFKGLATPQDLLSHLINPDFKVKTNPPKESSKIFLKISVFVGILMLIGLGAWVWKHVG